MSVNYMHICDNKAGHCECGWIGCVCELKYVSEKITDKCTALNQCCPKCDKIVISATQTTSHSSHD